MLKYPPSLLALALALLAGVFSHQGAAEEPLSGEQVRALITGNTLQGNFMANPLTMVFYEGGVVRGSVGMSGSDSGTWEIEGDHYCNEWVTYFSGTRHCYQWLSHGDRYVLKNVDTFRGRDIQGRIEKGKPKGY